MWTHYSSLRLQVLPIGIVDKPHGSADPAWLPRYHIRYSQRAMDMLDGLPKWCGAAMYVNKRVSDCMYNAHALYVAMRISASACNMCLWPRRSGVKDSSELLHD